MALDNKSITLHGNPIEVIGDVKKIGDKCPEFVLTGKDLKDIKFNDLIGRVILLSVVPSVDTPTCQIQTKTLSKEFNSLGKEFLFLTVSRDLPFALSRFCSTEDINNTLEASDYKYRKFGLEFGVEMAASALLARALFVIDKTGIINYVEYVGEVSEEPDYAAALSALRKL